MLPVRDAGQDDAVEVGEDLGEGLACSGADGGREARTSPGETCDRTGKLPIRDQ